MGALLIFVNDKKTGLLLARFSFGMVLGFLLANGAGVTSALAQSGGSDLYVAQSAVSNSQLLRVQTLIKANVLDLAESILETEGPPTLPTNEWLAWEKQLWTLYRVKGDWQSLLNRISQIPLSFPIAIKREGDVQLAHALIQSNQATRARNILRKQLIASGVSELDKRDFRRLIIESYLIDNLLPEARMSMEKYQLDYRSQEADWLLLSAQIYLKLENPDSAINLLAPLDNPEAKLLGIYARLKNSSISPEQAVKKVNALLEGKLEVDQSNLEESGLDTYDALAVVIFAKSLDPGSLSILNELESYLIQSDKVNSGSNRVYPRYSKADLLEAYGTIALSEANKKGLLIGEHEQWVSYALALPDGQISKKKAIFGYLATLIQEPGLKLKINDAYIDTLIQSDHIELVSQLYGEGNPFGVLRLTGRAGLVLSNAAISKGNVVLADKAHNSFSGIPLGMSESQWKLHVARIAIIAGQYDQGVSQISFWIKSFNRLTPDQTDQVLQPVFDLQTVQRHTSALQLLHEINDRVASPKHRREIAYWIAQSYQATNQHIKAADYFLYSAMLKDNGFDQWGESARYNAAEALLSAKLVSDAKVLVEDLLARAQAKSRKLQLQQKLQELWLLEASMISIEPKQKSIIPQVPAKKG